MELIIGREHATNKLIVTNGTQVKIFKELPELPTDVSSKHCKITDLGGDSYMITAIKNKTTVNCLEIESKKIKLTDKVQLGDSGYVLPLDKILGFNVESDGYDISHLKAVWDNYNNGMIEIKKLQRRYNLLFRIPMVFTLLGGLISAFSPGIVPIALTVVAFVVMLYGLYKMATDKSIEKQEKLRKQFLRDYVCPNPDCHHYLGYKDYELLIREMTRCPYCKAKFKH